MIEILCGLMAIDNMFIYNTIININPVLLWASFITHLLIDDIRNDPYFFHPSFGWQFFPHLPTSAASGLALRTGELMLSDPAAGASSTKVTTDLPSGGKPNMARRLENPHHCSWRSSLRKSSN